MDYGMTAEELAEANNILSLFWNNDGSPRVAEQTNDENAAEFEQEMARADDSVISNDQTVMGSAARLHRGQFYRHAASHFGAEAADLAYTAWFLNTDIARRGAAEWQAFKRLQATSPDLFAILVGAIKWRRGVEDRGPLGNDWNE